jgi:hypothetical protein
MYLNDSGGNDPKGTAATTEHCPIQIAVHSLCGTDEPTTSKHDFERHNLVGTGTEKLH